MYELVSVWKVERCFAWYQSKYRRLVVRWERLPQVFNGFLALATIHMWITKIS